MYKDIYEVHIKNIPRIYKVLLKNISRINQWYIENITKHTTSICIKCTSQLKEPIAWLSKWLSWFREFVNLSHACQGFYSNRMPNSSTLFCTRGFSCAVQFGQTTPNSDVILLYDIYQLLELKPPKNDFSWKL